MHDLAQELRQTVANAVERLLAIPEPQTQAAQGPDDWTIKDILGHLIDSAANNHQRFIRAQASDDLVFDGYDQEQWVRAQRYTLARWHDLVQLWKAYNDHLAHVIAGIPDPILHKPRAQHTLDKIGWQPVSADQPTTLAYLIGDYIGHLQAHLRQIDDRTA